MDQGGRDGLRTERCNLRTRPYTRVDKASGEPDLRAYGKPCPAAVLFVYILRRRTADSGVGGS